jgi:ribonuclease J
MRICIRRGAKQIGGTCIEIESRGKRLVLDVGQPLDCPDADAAEMPSVRGLEKADDSLLGVVLSHPHLDHYGLAYRVPRTTTFLMGEAAERILAAAAVFTPAGGTFDRVTHLVNRKPIILGPFTVTPFLMDHSAYDSYALLIESEGKRMFYTGDLRGHGRKAKLFERLVAYPPKHVDVLLMEGTTITRTGTDEGFPTERDLENDLVGLFRDVTGMPLVWCSGQNIDRLVTVYRAAKRSNRQFIIDMYTAHILAATGNPRIPQADWKGVRVFLPTFQKRRIKRNQRFDVSDTYKAFRIFPEHVAEAAGRSVMLFRPSMCRDVEDAGCLSGARLVYSMWEGYLVDKEQKPFLAWLQDHGIPLHECHTSGHAPLRDLRRLREAFSTATVVPVHTEQPLVYRGLFRDTTIHKDGEWWPVGSNTKQESEQQ